MGVHTSTNLFVLVGECEKRERIWANFVNPRAAFAKLFVSVSPLSLLP